VSDDGASSQRIEIFFRRCKRDRWIASFAFRISGDNERFYSILTVCGTLTLATPHDAMYHDAST